MKTKKYCWVIVNEAFNEDLDTLPAIHGVFKSQEDCICYIANLYEMEIDEIDKRILRSGDNFFIGNFFITKQEIKTFGVKDEPS
jgi:hypothetical protein